MANKNIFPIEVYVGSNFNPNLDKDIIDNKSLWPLYSIVNKFKMSHAEWTKISEKFNKKPIVTTPISNE